MIVESEKNMLISLIKKAINGDEASRRILARRNIRLSKVDIDFLIGDDSNPEAEVSFTLHPSQIIDRKEEEASRIKMYENINERNQKAIEHLERPLSPVFFWIVLPIIICLIIVLLGVKK